MTSNREFTGESSLGGRWPHHGDGGDWSTLGNSVDATAFASAWLSRQSSELGEDLLKAIVVFGAGPGSSLAPIAVWPAGSMGSPNLVAAIERTIKTGKVEVRKGSHPGSDDSAKVYVDVIAYPLMVSGNILGAAAFELKHRSDDALQERLSQLNWGSAWLEVLAHRSKDSSADRLITALNSVATVIDQDRFQGSATSIATELAGKLRCDRLSIGFLLGKHIRVAALSHSANFDAKASVVRAIEAAMDESIDQQSTIVFPVLESAPLKIIRSHEELSEHHKIGSICTIPLASGDKIFGAITLERPIDDPFDQQTVRLCEQIAALVGPILDLKRKDDRPLFSKAGDSFRSFVRHLFGPRYTGLKLGTLLAVVLLLFFTFATGDYRVTADARLEGLVRRAVSAPMDGYLSSAHVRAGDTVGAGDVMFTLDNRDLTLERLKWASQHSKYSREYTEALAKHERARAAVLSAQIEQADAQIALIDEQLARTTVIAPFDSYVVSGDLSQALGAPVERGDVLFEITPLNAYRVVLNVEERDIGAIRTGQSGHLVVTGMPDRRLPFLVERVTPVASADQGINAFRVEAHLQTDDLALLRPGMEGYGKVEIDRRKLIWIWTHKIVHWIRMFIWSWWP